MQEYFNKFRQNVIGIDSSFTSPYGEKKIIYADWTASGRLYSPIENTLTNVIGPNIGNTHTETSFTGSVMTHAYHKAKQIIKDHVGANDKDIIIASGSGMTDVMNKFQRIIGLRVYEKYVKFLHLSDEDRPVIFVTSMEHHSNQTSWVVSIGTVELIGLTAEGNVNLDHLKYLLDRYSYKKTKIASITSCSNVTGIMTPYHEIAGIMHEHGGYCFVDFAASAPYIDINMHPEKEEESLDAIFFSPHKFLGGPGTAGILVFNSDLYHNHIPDNPGGGTVDWTNPWGNHKFVKNIEQREDGGTPPFMQTIKAALCLQLKEEMGTANIKKREEQINKLVWERLSKIPGVEILENKVRERLPIFSFYIDGAHYNLVVKLLNDRFGIQVRGGCSCAGTYGHILLHVNRIVSDNITSKISKGDLSLKPGWIRMSAHPTMTDEEIIFICDAIAQVAANHSEWGEEYEYDAHVNDFTHKSHPTTEIEMVSNWFGGVD